MANFGLEVVCDTHIFYGTQYARWKRHMLDHFRDLGPKAWWIIVVGFLVMLWIRTTSPKHKRIAYNLIIVLFII